MVHIGKKKKKGFPLYLVRHKFLARKTLHSVNLYTIHPLKALNAFWTS